MKSFLGKVNKKVTGNTKPTRSSSGSNSETDSETLKALEEVNKRLKDRKIKAKLVIARNSLFIRGTYRDSNGINKERKIPTRLTADINNLVSAEARILQLIEYVNKNGFVPDELMWDAPKVELNGSKGLLVGEAVKRFEINYWKGKKKTKPRLQTWNLINKGYLMQLPQDAEINVGLLVDFIENDSEPETDKRRKMCQYFKRLALANELKGFSIIDNYVGKYAPKKRNEVEDEELINLIDICREDKKYGWLTAAQYVYGTRSGETFSLIPDLKNGTATSINTPKGGKPMDYKYPIALTNDLAKRWHLDEIDRPYTCNLKTYDPEMTKYLGDHWRRFFKRRAKKVGLEWLQLTDLRHQWGIRSIYAEIDPRAAAKSMGHSIAVHYSTYNSTYGKKDAIRTSKKINK